MEEQDYKKLVDMITETIYKEIKPKEESSHLFSIPVEISNHHVVWVQYICTIEGSLLFNNWLQYSIGVKSFKLLWGWYRSKAQLGINIKIPNVPNKGGQTIISPLAFYQRAGFIFFKLFLKKRRIFGKYGVKEKKCNKKRFYNFKKYLDFFWERGGDKIIIKKPEKIF